DPERRVVVWSVPKPDGGARAPAGGARRTLARAAAAKDAAPAIEFSLKGARRVTLDNGLTLLLYENRRLPIVVTEAAVHRVRMLEPEDKPGVATLMGRLLDEGTEKHTGQQIAEQIEDVGGVLSLSGAGGSVQVLAQDRSLGLGLLFECLTQPAF